MNDGLSIPVGLARLLVTILIAYGSLMFVALVMGSQETSVTIGVTTQADQIADDGSCSLREAIMAANRNLSSGNQPGECIAGSAGTDIIRLPDGIYLLDELGSHEDEGETGDLDLMSDLEIQGSGEESTIIDAGGIDRVFHIGDFAVNISGVTIRGGKANTGTQNNLVGGGVYIDTGALTLVDSTVRDNEARVDGGGIFNDKGTLNMINIKVHGNLAGRNGDGIHNYYARATLSSVVIDNNNGHGVYNSGTSQVTLNRSAIVNNEAAGLVMNGTGNLVVENTTFSGNKVWGVVITDAIATLTNVTFYTSDSLYNSGGTVYLVNTILAGGCSGIFISLGNNIEPNNSCGLDSQGDKPFTNPLLSTNLRDNGGHTLTHALGAVSPAIDAGDNGRCPDNDQRGFVPRPVDGDNNAEARCDVGAYEEGATEPILAPPITSTGQLMFLPLLTNRYPLCMDGVSEVEPNNGIDTATGFLCSGAAYVGAHSGSYDSEDKDFFKIIIGSAGAITADVAHAHPGLQLAIGAADKMLCDAGSSKYSVVCQVERGGVYYIRVYMPRGYSREEYTLIVTFPQ